MENVTTHSKAKLALAVFTSPAAAFEEIARRRLLGTALFIVGLTGAAAMAPWILAARSGEPLQIMMLGKSNPIAWLGLCMLFVWVMQKLLKWLGTQVEFVDLLVLVGWAQVALLVAQIASIVLFATQAEPAKHQIVMNAAMAFYALGLVWYVAMMGQIVHTLTGAPKARGVLTYLVVYAAATIAFSMTYSRARVAPFEDALTGVSALANAIVSADQTPWLAAAVVGLVAGAILLGRAYEWPVPKTKMAAIVAGAIGLAALGGYVFGISQLDYYGRLARANNLYLNSHYAQAARGFSSLLGLTKNNLSLTLDVADVYYLANEDGRALEYLKKAEKSVASQGPDTKKLSAVVADHYGLIYYSQDKYPDALAEFQKATKDWPEFREPWVRMAVIYDRTGQYDKAIESANHALRKLDSEATVAWVALAQAFAQTGDTTQEKAAVAIVVGRDKMLAARIGSGPGGWKDAVSRLSREDLKFPLERDLAPQPKGPERSKKK